MPLDKTDKKLVNGAIWVVVICVVAYFVPSVGYQALETEEVQERDKLLDTKKNWDKHYTTMHPAVYGAISTDAMPEANGRFVADIKQEYDQNSTVRQEQIELLQGTSRMSFPAWTEIPAEKKKEPGVYFAQTWERKKFELENDWRVAKVECLDPDIGFELKGIVIQADENKARELLREMHIAESIIRLCIKAKQREEDDERKKGLQPEAYMKIIKVVPQPSVPAGPSALIPNPRYRKDEKNPGSEAFRKYNVFLWKNFIQEYPVEIQLQCDYNTFQRFLHSVRTPGQFLVIRSLEILSPFANESIADKTEATAFLSKLGTVGPDNRLPVKDEHIMVKISAAGMDFFDPEKFPYGLYNNNKEADPKGKATPRRRLGPGGAAGAGAGQ
jgi:hypothetical protein